MDPENNNSAAGDSGIYFLFRGMAQECHTLVSTVLRMRVCFLPEIMAADESAAGCFIHCSCSGHRVEINGEQPPASMTD